MEILYQSGVDHMDIPRGEIILESPLEFVDLGGVLQKFKGRGYLEILIMGGEIEEGYVFIENESIIGIFYEGQREGEPLQNVQELLREKPAVILHRLTETQLNVLKEFYPLDKKYGMGEIFGAEGIAKSKEAVMEKRVEEARTKPLEAEKITEEIQPKPTVKPPKAEEKKAVAVPKEWGDRIPQFSGTGVSQMTVAGMAKEEFLENVDPFVRDILAYIDGKRDIREIIRVSGQTPEDVIGVIEPYKRMGYIKFKE
jgi:hypothetical protein